MKQQHKGSRQQSGDNTRKLYQRPSGRIKPSSLRGDNSETERRGDNDDDASCDTYSANSI